MASTIKLKNGSGAPTTGDLVQGEPALDLTNKRLYTENASGVVIEVGTNPSTIDINAGTIDGTVIGGSTAAAGTFTSLTASGDVNFDSNTLFVDASANAVGIGTSSPSSALTVEGDGTFRNTTDATGSFVKIADNADRSIIITSPISAGSAAGRIATAGTANSLEVGVRDYPTAITISGASGNVGIGASSPAAKLQVEGETRIYPASGTAILRFGSGGAEKGKLSVDASSNMAFETANSEAMRIDSSGSVGIGTSSPSAKLDIAGMAAGEVGLQITSPRNDAITNGLAYINVTDSVAPFAALKINHAGTGPAIVALGNVGIGTSSPAAKLEIGGAGEGIILASPDGTRYEITVANGGTLTVTAV